MTLPRQVKTRDPITAALFNSVLEALEETPQGIGSAGLGATASGNRVVYTLLRAFERTGIVPARITAVTAVGSPPRVQDVTYSAAAIYNPSAVVTNEAPKNRVFETGPACVPAAVGDLCLIVRAPDGSEANPTRVEAQLWVYTERLIGTECTSGGTTTTNPPPDQPLEEPPPLIPADGSPQSVTFQPPIGGLPA